PSVHLLHSGPLAVGSCLLSAAPSGPPSLVQLTDDGVAHLLQLLLLVLVLVFLSQLVVLQPADGLLALVHHLLLVLLADLALQALVLHAALHGESVGLQGVLGSYLVPLQLVLGFVLLGVLHHPLDLLFAQSALVV
uniref:Uncharacterized protein n=1 Tax=Poecilia formosa TaxID=48698 RepID=A0A087YSI9_POEFO